jgi:hypothetical protein
MVNDSSGPYRGPIDPAQVRVCPRCGAYNSLSASYCIGCGDFLPPPVGHPSYQPIVPQPQPQTGLSVPLILLIISIILTIVVAGLFLIAISST